MGNEISRRPAAQTLDDTYRVAKGFALSGYFQDAKSAEQALVKIMAGSEMGLSAFQSMTGIHVISGKPVVGAGLLAAMIDQHPDYDYSVTWEPDQATATACTVTILKNGAVKGDSRFSLEDAKRAGLSQQNWSKFPSNMLFARAMSNAVRWYAAGVTGTSVYVEGEIAHDSPAPSAPNGATAKPRTRVTAEVVPDLVEDVQDADVELDYEPVSTPALSVQLKSMPLQDRADLYELVGIEKGTPLGKVRDILADAEKTFGIDEGGEPNAAAVLACAKQAQRDALPDDAADAFDHFAKTGQDLSEDPQTAIA